MPESSLQELWCKSEKSYFGIYMINFIIDEKLVNGQLENGVVNLAWHTWESIIRIMRAEQVRHLPGGDAHAQDPWPARIFTPSDLQNLWDRNKEEFRQIRPSSQRQAAIIARSLHHLYYQSNFGTGELRASKILLESKNYYEICKNDEFWREFEKYFGGN